MSRSKAKRISVEEAAKQLRIGKLAVRKRMLLGELPIGHVLVSEGKKGKFYSFCIYQDYLDKYIRDQKWIEEHRNVKENEEKENEHKGDASNQ